jgi:predicted nucleic acid-binding protein
MQDGGLLIASPPRGSFSPDPKDDPFFQCAIAGEADYIVTDNLRHFSRSGLTKPEIILPEKAIALLFSK